MTEDEAKTKWCPFARVVQPAGDWAPLPAGNREVVAPATEALNKAALCIGAACMAWRTAGWKFKDGRTGRLSDQDLTGYGTWIPLGHCGLAGAPVQ